MPKIQNQITMRKVSSETIFLLFMVDSFDHQRCVWRPRPGFPFTTVPIIASILRDDSAFSTAICAFYFRPVITKFWAFFTSGSRESHSIWKSCALLDLNSSTSFVDELYRQQFDTPNHFLVYLLINRSIISTFVIDTSYTYIGHDNWGNNKK